MKFISTKVHGILDYAGGILFILSPWILGFNHIAAAVILPVAVGALMILMAVFTNFELGAVKKITVADHLMLDASAGVLLAVSPWLFGFSEEIFAPHLILGSVESMAAMFTKTISTTHQGESKAPGELTRTYLEPEK